MSEKQQFYISLEMRDKQESGNNNDRFIITKENLISILIRENVLSILPKLELTIGDGGGLLETFPLTDGDVMRIIISKSEFDDVMLDCNFVISDFIAEPNTTQRTSIIKMVGYLDTNEMFFPSRDRAFFNNSVNVLRTITNELQYDFVNPHNIQTNDRMRWYQINTNNYDFIKHILQRSYKNDDTIFYYGTTRNNFVCTSLNFEMEKREDFKAFFDVDKAQSFYLDPDNPNAIYYDRYDIMNLVGLNHKITMYGEGFKGYDLRGNLTSGFSFPKRKMTQLYNRDIDYHTIQGKSSDMGTVKSNLNLYNNYDKAKTQNRNLRREFFAQNISISVDGLTNVKLFDKINLYIPSIFVANTNQINDVYSGYYLVIGIVHTITYGNTYRRYLILSRNGINRSEIDQQYAVV